MKVFFNPLQVAQHADAFSPSAGKPGLVVESWQALGLAIERVDFEPLERADLALAHDRAYVDGILDCQRPNGFGNRLASVAASLPYTTGSLYAAAAHAVTTGESTASPTSGFHHACYDSAGGYCTFNGLVIAARKLARAGLTRRVGILDLDMHYGNGTVNILEKLGLTDIVHYSFGRDPLAERATAEQWLAELPHVLQLFAEVDVVIYQAGADPHVDDPLGGVLTTAQLLERDRVVFQALRDLKVPCAWNLAGGYQTPLRKVLALHDNTAKAFVETFEPTPALP